MSDESFDHLDHAVLVQLIERRVGDPRVLRLIQKWLRAGVSEEGEWPETKVGDSARGGGDGLNAKDNFQFERVVRYRQEGKRGWGTS